MSKDLKEKAIKIKGKDYVQVKDRILYLSEEVKEYSIETDYQYFPERKMWVVKATLKMWSDTNGGGTLCTYTGLAQEVESDNYKEVNHTSALENAETSAVGRACAMAGIGVLDSIASVDEINKATNRTPQQLVRTGKCSICGAQGMVGKWGAYCENRNDAQHKGKKATFSEPLSKENQSIADDLDSIPVIK